MDHKEQSSIVKKLKAFFYQNGHCYVPKNSEYNDLYEASLRLKESRLRLQSKTVDELDAMQFDWVIYSSNDGLWLSRYYELRLFKDRFGHCRVSSGWKENRSLARWVSRQREHELEMFPYRKKLLDQIGFYWYSDMLRHKEEKWWNNYKELVKFDIEHGHSRPSTRGETKSLGLWVSRLREYKSRLNQEQIQKLDEIGFLWKEDMEGLYERNWNMMLDQLKDFQKKHGHCKVPNRYAENEKLGIWVSGQRVRFDSLLPWMKEALNEIGFLWKEDIEKLKEDLWMQRYNELKQFFEEHGHSRVPSKYPQNVSLGRWVDTQFTIRARISDERKRLLDTLNFPWEGVLKKENEKKWKDRYKRLQAYFDHYGHSQVPEAWNEDQELASWVVYLRTFKERQNASQLKKLKKLNFKWKEDLQSERDDKWKKQYRKLVAFKKKYNHFLLTRQPADADDRLIKWVKKQRRIRSSMATWREDLLNDIDFPWQIRRAE